ncbi:MAG: OmpA family protein [Deltaproteobacteria bacterium]|nr:OmpA family protein [Deltaproteobacteria bacterium]MBW2390868.1 OmpA family protein [Deltaproteobacteria bacterium]
MLVLTRTVTLTALLASALGCVSAGTHEAMMAERDGLTQQAEGLTADKALLEGRIQELDAELASLASTNSTLSAQVNASAKKVTDLSGTYQALVANLESELASGQVEIQQMRDGLQVNVADDVLFLSGSAQIDARGRAMLQKVAEQLLAIPNPIRVEGHTDDIPISGALASRYPTNWELAGARAASVVRLMAEDGVESSRMRAVSSGEYSPRALNDSDEGRAQNRRIEIRLLPMIELENVATREAPEAVSAGDTVAAAAVPADS